MYTHVESLHVHALYSVYSPPDGCTCSIPAAYMYMYTINLQGSGQFLLDLHVHVDLHTFFC